MTPLNYFGSHLELDPDLQILGRNYYHSGIGEIQNILLRTEVVDRSGLPPKYNRFFLYLATFQLHFVKFSQVVFA